MSRKLTSLGLNAHRPRKKKKTKMTFIMKKKRFAWAKVVQEQFGNDRRR